MTLKQFVYKTLDEKGYITDSDVVGFSGKEESLYTAVEYKRQWKRLQADRAFVENYDGEVIGVSRGRRCYLVEFEKGFYKVGKEYWHEIYPRFQKYDKNKKYFFRGNELYNIKELFGSFVGHDLEAHWKDKNENSKEKLGRFYLRELDIV